MYALGLIETRGLVTAIEAADVMVKSSDVSIIEKTYIGGGLVTITVTGDVSAAASVGKLTAHNVMPRPIKPVGDIVSVHDIDL